MNEFVALMAELSLVNPGLAGDLRIAADEAQSILSLPANWDDEGSPAILPSTLNRAVAMLIEADCRVFLASGRRMPAPRIMPRPEGSVDLHWRTPRWEVLMNVPENLREAAHYYGDNYGSDKRKGEVAP